MADRSHSNFQFSFFCVVHVFRNLPELSAEDFSEVDLSQYSWIHFEVRALYVAIILCMYTIMYDCWFCVYIAIVYLLCGPHLGMDVDNNDSTNGIPVIFTHAVSRVAVLTPIRK